MQQIELRAMYKLKKEPGRTVYTNSQRFKTVSELLQSLGKQAGLNTLTAQELVIHWIKPNGSVVEVLAFDAGKGHRSFSYFEPQAREKLGSNVTPIKEVNSKPVVRQVVEPPTPQTVSFGRYIIREAN